jgi:hypothetical protein
MVTNDGIIEAAAHGFAEAVSDDDRELAEKYAEAAFSARYLAGHGIAVRLSPDGLHEESTGA